MAPKGEAAQGDFQLTPPSLVMGKDPLWLMEDLLFS